MAKIEIDEVEWAERQRVYEAAVLIGKDPARRAQLQALLAEAAPDKAGDVPLLRQEIKGEVGRLEKLVGDFIESQKTEREQRVAEDAKRDLERRWLEGRGKLRDAGYNDEGITKVEEMMEKRGIADHEAAMALFERDNPPPEPVATGGSHWNFFDRGTTEDVNFKALLNGEDEAFLGSAIPAALKEVRGR